MTHRVDVTLGRDIVARWCNLAEQRLEHLTELFETGRWRRYHSEQAFLENIQEAKAAVETWRDLLLRESSQNNSAIDMTRPGDARRSGASTPHHDRFREPSRPAPEPIAVAVPRDIPADILVALESQIAVAEQSPSVSDAPDLDAIPVPALDLDAIQQRYPLLRNAL